MQEIASGLWHWTARHPHVAFDLSSYHLLAERVLLDPLLPAEGAGWFTERAAEPEHILLTNRHDARDSWRLVATFGCEVHCVANDCHELEGRGPVTPVRFGDEPPAG